MNFFSKLRGSRKKSKKPKRKSNPNGTSRVVTLRVIMAMFEGGTIKGLASAAGVSERTVFRVIDAAKLAGFKVNRTKQGIFRAVGRRAVGQSAARKRKKAGGE